jgi:hypothetical protein
MLEHAARNRTPALSSIISRLEVASEHWLISSAIRILCHVCGMDCCKEASEPVSQRHIAQELFIIGSRMSLIYTMSSSKEPSRGQQGHRPWKCLFLRSCTAGKLRSNFISLATTAFVRLRSYTDSWYFHTVLPFSLPGLASLIEFIITTTFPSSEMKQELIHETCICYANVTVESAAYNNTEVRHPLWWNYIAETLCEEIILQKRFVRKSNWNVQNIEKKLYNINFLSNTFQSGVINVTLCSLLIETKQISFIYHKNCVSYSIFSNSLQFFKCPTATKQEPNSSRHLN